MSRVCMVPLCICEPIALDIPLCRIHAQMTADDLEPLMQQRPSGLRPVTDRIEYDDDGLPVRFYPEVRE